MSLLNLDLDLSLLWLISASDVPPCERRGESIGASQKTEYSYFWLCTACFSLWLRVAHFSSVAALSVKLNAPVDNQGRETRG